MPPREGIYGLLAEFNTPGELVHATEEARRAAVGAQDKPTLREMIAAIDRHEGIVDAAREAKKKTLATAPASSLTSPSVAP